jgi:hypothetical protein
MKIRRETVRSFKYRVNVTLSSRGKSVLDQIHSFVLRKGR